MDKHKELEKTMISVGLSPDESRIYVSLLEVGKSTILEISKITGIPRTSVYRAIATLEDGGFVTKILAGRTYYQAKSIEDIALLLEGEERKFRNARNKVKKFEKIFGGFEYVKQPGTNVRFYKGKVGIRQMLWNMLEAKTEILGYTYRDVTEVVGKDFARKFRMEIELRNIRLRDIYMESYSEVKIMQIISDTNDSSRVVEPDILNIEHQLDIYNDIVAMYNWYKGEVFGIEIENPKIANTQRQIFEIVWGVARKPSS